MKRWTSRARRLAGSAVSTSVARVLGRLNLSRGLRATLGLLAPQVLAPSLGAGAVLAGFTAYTLILTEADEPPRERTLLHLLALVPFVLAQTLGVVAEHARWWAAPLLGLLGFGIGLLRAAGADLARVGLLAGLHLAVAWDLPIPLAQLPRIWAASAAGLGWALLLSWVPALVGRDRALLRPAVDAWR